MSINNKQQMLLKKKKKLNKILSNINKMPLQKQLNIYTDIIKLIRPIYKQNKTITKNKSIRTTIDRVYENIFDDICDLGLPFIKHRKNTKVYLLSIELIKKKYPRYRSQIIDIFKLGQEYFLNKYFIFKPEGGKISIPDFFKYNSKTLQFNPYLASYTKSWFNEFSKGRNHIEKNFMKRINDKYPILTNELIDIWQITKNCKCTNFDAKHAIICIKEIVKIAQLNNIDTRSILSVIKQIIATNDYIDSIRFLYTDKFLYDLLPKEMVKINLFRSIKDIKLKEK